MKNVFQELKERIFHNWESTIAAILVAIFLVIYWNDIDSLIKALGAVVTILGLIFKNKKKV